MNPASSLRRLLQHWLIAGVAALPVTLVVFALLQRGRGEAPGAGTLDLTVLYPGLLLFTTPGVLLYSGALAVLARHRPRSRGWALGLAPLLVVPWLLLPVRHLLVWPPFTISVGAGLVVFGLLAARMQRPATERQAEQPG